MYKTTKLKVPKMLNFVLILEFFLMKLQMPVFKDTKEQSNTFVFLKKCLFTTTNPFFTLFIPVIFYTIRRCNVLRSL